MKLKTYTASTMAQALAQVRKDLGSDAMILHTRSYRTGSWLGMGGKPMVEITASSPQPTKSRKSRKVREHTPQRMHEQRSEEAVAEIVVQRSRVAQPVSQRSSQAESSSASGTEQNPVDDRAALLQGLMGGARSINRPAARRDPGQAEPASSKPAPREEIVVPSVPVSDDGFRATTFRSLDPQDQITITHEHDESSAGHDQSNAESGPDIAAEHESLRHEEPFELRGSPLLSIEDDADFENAIAREHTIDRTRETSPILEAGVEEEVVEDAVEMVDAPAPDSPRAHAEPSAETLALQAQIQTLQKMMGQVLDSTRRTAVAVGKSTADGSLPPVEMSAPLHAMYLKLIDNDVSVELADRFVGDVRDRLDADEFRDPTVVRHALLREIESSITTVSESLLTSTRDPSQRGTARPHVLALIGPTGVGKTTTVAKLAATAKLRHGKEVALITSDTYRIAAVEQLRTYASIIGLQLRIANTPEEMKSVIASLSNADLIVIDTAGRSQNNHSRLDELGQLIDAAQPDETHLVLSSTVGENVLRKTAERFVALGPDRCILTKLDEAVTTGMIAGISDRIGVPLSFVTIGQEVPEDILPARADRLARAVLDGPEAVVPGL